MLKPKMVFTVLAVWFFLHVVIFWIMNPTGVEAFIDRQTGDLYKPASWNKPAKGIRFNLLDKESCEKLFKVSDPHGGHLYRR